MKSINVFEDEDLKQEFYKLQYQDFQIILQLYKNYIFSISIEEWCEIITKLSEVMKKCDEIDVCVKYRRGSKSQLDLV